MNKIHLISILSLCFLLSLTSTTFAHNKSESYSNWNLNKDKITGIITIPSHEVTRLPKVKISNVSLAEIFLEHAKANIDIYNENQNCSLQSNNILNSTEGFIRIELQYNCLNITLPRIHYRAIFETSPSHTHYAKIYKQGQMISELLINNASGPWEINPEIPRKANQSFLSFFALGMEHILGGYDHLAFLLGILLVAHTISRSIMAITGFTIGHSASLLAATIGYVETNGRIVEVFIAFTIMLIAIEFTNREKDRNPLLLNIFSLLLLSFGLMAYLFDRIEFPGFMGYLGLSIFTYCYLSLKALLVASNPNKTKYLLLITAILFGFIHGLGFAGFLMDTGIVGSNLLWPLLGFNLGLEFGQIGIVTLSWIIYHHFKGLIREPLPSLVSGGLFGLGFFWFMTRTFT